MSNLPKCKFHLVATSVCSFLKKLEKDERVCSKMCYNKRSKPVENITNPWHDYCPTPNLSAQSVLLDSLAIPENYEKWKRGFSGWCNQEEVGFSNSLAISRIRYSS